jgi:hypothetical protein
MSERSPTSGFDPPALHRFMERVTRSLGHDLRTPLGTIVNYALLVEQDAPSDADGLRQSAQRIRGQAMHTAEMLQLLLEATLLASRPPAPVPVDAVELLSAIVADFDGGATLDVGSDDGNGVPLVEVDPAVVGFAWRAYLELEKEVCPFPRRGASVIQERAGDRLQLGLRLGGELDPGKGAVDIDHYVDGKLPVAAPRRFALALGRDLVAAHCGELQLFGRAGVGSLMLLRLPLAIDARHAGRM